MHPDLPRSGTRDQRAPRVSVVSQSYFVDLSSLYVSRGSFIVYIGRCVGNSVVADNFGSRFIYLIYTHDGPKTEGDEGIETGRLILRSIPTIPIAQTFSFVVAIQTNIKFFFSLTFSN